MEKKRGRVENKMNEEDQRHMGIKVERARHIEGDHQPKVTAPADSQVCTGVTCSISFVWI